VIARSRGYGRTVTDAVADDFQRASLGANWTRPLGDAVIVNSQSLGAGSFSGVHIAIWNGATQPGANQFAEVRVATDIGDMQHQPFVRRRTSDGARYGLIYDTDSTPFWAIKYDGVPSQDTRLFLAPGYTTPLAPGDVMRLEARGSSPVSLRAYHNGRLVLAVDDSDANRVTSGPPGAAYRATLGAPALTYPSPVYETFAAGTLLT
jgi:hypothetical protein